MRIRYRDKDFAITSQVALDVEAFAALFADASEPVVAYCRTGLRAESLWELSLGLRKGRREAGCTSPGRAGRPGWRQHFQAEGGKKPASQLAFTLIDRIRLSLSHSALTGSACPSSPCAAVASRAA